MSVDRNRVKEVFFAALDVGAEEVAAYLDRTCASDTELRREVESLLAHHDERDLVEPEEISGMETALQPGGEGPSERIDTRYREIDELGVGGCGRVTSTWDRQLRRRVARKVLLSEDPGQRAMLLQEARLLAWLDHPGAVAVYDIDADEGDASYTMRLLDGETLRARLDRSGPLNVHEAIRILGRLSETMANAHGKGVLHLDLKPANLMLLPYGQVCVLDWGVAQFHDIDAYSAYLRSSGESEAPQVAAYPGIAGTPSYMPVEQAQGRELGPATDIYAAGTILYEMLAGALPSGPSDIPSAAKERRAPPPPLRTHRADIPERLEALCARMLAPDPSDRPTAFTDVLDELAELYGAELGVERTLQPGEVLFREGDRGTQAFQILEGVVALTVDGPGGPTEIARRTVGDLIGEMAVVLDAPRSATVTAVDRTRLAVVTGDVIADAMRSANPLLARMIRSLSARLREEADRVKRG